MKLVLMALIGLFFATELLSQEQPAPSTEAPSTEAPSTEEPSSRRRSEAPSSGSEGEALNYRNGQLFEAINDCENSDCPCCLFLGHRTINEDQPDEREIDATVCSTDHSQMEDVTTEWGADQTITVSGHEFHIYNAEPAQVAVIQEALSVLPDYYLDAVPQSFRIGNPGNGSLRTSPTASMVNVPRRSQPVHQGDLYHETIGGGSRRCHEQNDDYEYIILHPLVFVPHPKEKPVRTILHEVGHFVEREYNISNRFIRRYRSEFSAYLDTYNGDSRGNDEVIASGICYYFLTKNWRRDQTRYETPLTRVRPTAWLPQWLIDIVLEDMASRS